MYLVKGKNGAGKTTILKNIIFEKKFADHNRNHFAYAEQEPEKYNTSIGNYVKRYNKNVDSSHIFNLINKFHLNYLDLHSSLMSVSGGELVKLNLIACLLKDTDFIFLDEPTNNLDNKSVDVLFEVIDEIATEKVVVIVSHDPRIQIKNAHVIEIKNNKIDVRYSDTLHNCLESNENKKKIKYPFCKVIMNHIRKLYFVAGLLLLLIYTFAIVYLNDVVFQQ